MSRFRNAPTEAVVSLQAAAAELPNSKSHQAQRMFALINFVG